MEVRGALRFNNYDQLRMSNILMTFVVPVLNGEKYIGRCLSSIQNQNFQEGEYEILVLDNGSTDKTVEIVQHLGIDCEILPNLHVSALRNHGVLKARGQYLAFVDSDVEIFPYWIKNGMVAFQQKEVVAAGCFPTVPSNATWVQKAWDLHQCGRQYFISMKPIAWLPSMNLIVKRDDFVAIKGFAEELKTAEDVDLCYRLGTRGTILINSGMEAVHWGEAPDLSTFWRKEVWRGLGNLQGVFSHGFRLDELPSLGYPVYFLTVLPILCLGGVFDFFKQQFLIVPISLLFLFIPPFILSGRTAWFTKSFAQLPQLFVLYLVYGIARAYAILRSLSSLKMK